MNTNKQIAIMIALMAVLVVSCGAYLGWEPFRQRAASEWQEEVKALRGANLFVNNCRFCHGIAGEGGVGPALDRPEMRPDDPQQRKLTRDLIINTLTCGRVGTPMPAWSQKQGGPLNDEQLEQLATLILTGSWPKVAELGRHADQTSARLARDISPTDTMIPVTNATVAGTNDSLFSQDMLIRIGFEQMKVIEAQPTALRVQRGANNTRAEAHRAGDTVYNAPTPPDPLPINQQACGQGKPEVGPPPPPGEIYIVNFIYNPANYQAQVGDRITWTNKDTVAHTVTTDPDPTRRSTYPQNVDSGNLNQNQTFSHTFTQAGIFNYYCSLHPYMKATVTVTGTAAQ